jgi:molybdopterin biosynthesis enzyme
MAKKPASQACQVAAAHESENPSKREDRATAASGTSERPYPPADSSTPDGAECDYRQLLGRPHPQSVGGSVDHSREDDKWSVCFEERLFPCHATHSQERYDGTRSSRNQPEVP